MVSICPIEGRLHDILGLNFNAERNVKMRPDINKYLPMLDGYDMNHEQKVQFIHDLWHVMESFVDQAFGVHPVQQVGNKKSKRDLQDTMQTIESPHNQT